LTETRPEDDPAIGDCSFQVGIQPGQEAEGCAQGMPSPLPLATCRD